MKSMAVEEKQGGPIFGEVITKRVELGRREVEKGECDDVSEGNTHENLGQLV